MTDEQVGGEVMIRQVGVPNFVLGDEENFPLWSEGSTQRLGKFLKPSKHKLLTFEKVLAVVLSS